MSRFHLPMLIAITVLLCAVPSAAQDSVVDRIRGALDGIARGVDLVGQRASDLLGPGLGDASAEPPSHSVQRTFTERYPVDQAPVIAVSNQFGDIRLDTWSDYVVQLQAVITVGADSEELATQLSEATEILVNPSTEVVDMATRLPESPTDQGGVIIRVDYVLTVPRDANVVIDNFFGDTYVRETRGVLAVNAQYGAVELQRIEGPVSARVTGEFPLKAYDLAAGGAFDLSGAVAEFSDVTGDLRVQAFRSVVTVRDLPLEGLTDIANESGTVTLQLPEGLDPDLTATVIYGKLESAIELNRTEQPSRVLGRRSSQSNGHRIKVRSVFGDVSIQSAAASGQAIVSAPADTQVYNDTLTNSESAEGLTRVEFRAITGDLTIVPSDSGAIDATATRAVWVEQALDAPRALEAMELRFSRAGETLAINTLTAGDMADFGASKYQMNVQLRVPPDLALRVEAESGETRVSGMAEALEVVQQKGQIRVSGCAGTLDLSNQSGGVALADSMAKAKLAVRYGDCEVTSPGGPLEINCVEGRTIVDGPADGLVIRNNGGDVKVLTLDGVRGEYDIRAEDANINLLLDPFAHASLTLATEEGQVYTGHPLQGSIEHNRRRFQGRLNDGTHAIRLEAVRGNIVLD